jgi:predicted FMN-binding regulatory protein PaiB
MQTAARTAWKLRERPADFAGDAANLIIEQEVEITKLRYALTKIAEGNDPLTVMRSIARQALNKK